MFVAIIKCIFIGLAVGLIWLPMCFVACLFFYCLRDAGIILLLFLIPGGAICTWIVTRKYLLKETNRLRGAVALGARYFFLGAAIGIILAGCACDVSGTTFFGGFVGAMVGSLGGAFQGWLWPRIPVDKDLHQTIEVCGNATTPSTTRVVGEDIIQSP
jgi:hypothetical protein